MYIRNTQVLYYTSHSHHIYFKAALSLSWQGSLLFFIGHSHLRFYCKIRLSFTFLTDNFGILSVLHHYQYLSHHGRPGSRGHQWLCLSSLLDNTVRPAPCTLAKTLSLAARLVCSVGASLWGLLWAAVPFITPRQSNLVLGSVKLICGVQRRLSSSGNVLH